MGGRPCRPAICHAELHLFTRRRRSRNSIAVPCDWQHRQALAATVRGRSVAHEARITDAETCLRPYGVSFRPAQEVEGAGSPTTVVG